MTYTELVTFVADICENTFPTVDMDMFIKQAEQKIYNTVQIANLRKNVTGLTTANNKYLSAPNDFLSVYSIAIYPLTGPNANEYTYLLTKDVNFIREAYPKATDTGQPAHYAIFGPNSALPDELTFILGPTPDVQYPGSGYWNCDELQYYYYPESIVTAGGDQLLLPESYISSAGSGGFVAVTVVSVTNTNWLSDNFRLRAPQRYVD
jgi:hypothetical protein